MDNKFPKLKQQRALSRYRRRAICTHWFGDDARFVVEVNVLCP